MTTISTSNTPVPMCDLGAQLAPLRGAIESAIGAVLDSQAFIMGPQVGELEAQVAAYCSCEHAIGCSSGSDALVLALMALGVGPGDEVITSPFTFFATVGAISRLGARPVFVDIEPQSFNLDPERLAAARTPRTKAIIPVHLFGQTAEMDPIVEFASREGLAVVEDAAQAIGAEYRGRKAGSMGRIGCFSFFPSKNLGCLGDGGMVVTDDAELAEKMRLLRVHGARKKYIHAMVGGNFRLDTLQAAVLLVKLQHLEQWNDARRARAATYRRLIAASDAASLISLPEESPFRRHVYNQFVIRTPQRDRVIETFRILNIGTAIYYPLGMHMQECFRDAGYRAGDFPHTERACLETCALPMYPELADEQQNRVVRGLVEALAN